MRHQNDSLLFLGVYLFVEEFFGMVKSIPSILFCFAVGALIYFPAIFLVVEKRQMLTGL